MRKFICHIFWFLLPVIVFCIVGLFLPTTPYASESLLVAGIQKDSLIKNTKPPRIIFIGGSNLSFGLNSQTIKDSLKLNPINTAIHASIGLKYMMDDAIQYIQAGDTVILVPEYSHFFRSYNFGSNELLRTIFDVNRSKFRLLSIKQIINIMPYVPAYALSKFKPTEYFYVKEDEFYSVNSFNKYGDAYKQWGKTKQKFDPKKVDGKYNPVVIKKIKEFQTKIEKKHAIMYISYPGFQDLSFSKSIDNVKKVESEYIKNGFKILGTPERYMMPDSVMFNTPYHLIKKGVDYRT